MSEEEKNPPPPPITLGGWNFYFLAKLVLYWRGEIGWHPLENIAFAAFLLVPIESRLWRKARSIAALPIGVALLYYDSWLPPFKRAISQAYLLSTFTFSYLMELLERFFNPQIAAILFIAWAAYRILARRVRIGVIVGLALLLLPIAHKSQNAAPLAPIQSAATAAAGGMPSKTELDAQVQAFFAKEAGRNVAFHAPPATDAPFDVIFVHVCSLSWDDVHAVGLDNHPLWQNFDYLFTNFDSASTYSGPAAIRILRSTCGQTTHAGLYDPAPEKCYLMQSLKDAGFEPSLAMNHDGHFDDFLKSVQAQGGMNISQMSDSGLLVDQHAFDDSPVYDDLSVLSHWFDLRQKNDAPRVALYYNTISLHDGNHIVGDGNRSSLETYKTRLSKLLDELNGFMQKIAASGRRAVVVMIPEHGAAVRGDKMQIAGLREIPTPNITLVPVGIKVVGPDVKRTGQAMRIDKPTSFLAANSIVARMLDKSPFSAAGFSPADYGADLPETDYVAENQGMLMLRRQNRYFLRQDPDGWSEYDAASK